LRARAVSRPDVVAFGASMLVLSSSGAEPALKGSAGPPEPPRLMMDQLRVPVPSRRWGGGSEAVARMSPWLNRYSTLATSPAQPTQRQRIPVRRIRRLTVIDQPMASSWPGCSPQQGPAELVLGHPGGGDRRLGGWRRLRHSSRPGRGPRTPSAGTRSATTAPRPPRRRWRPQHRVVTPAEGS
jgi:hypothetical protein